MSKRRPPPVLSRETLLAAMANNPASASMARRRPQAVWDAHVHLWATPRILDKLDWNKTEATAVVQTDHDAKRYTNSISACMEKVEGATYVQIEIRHAKGEWEHAIDEIRWLVEDQLKDIPQVSAIIAWAPMPEGAESVESYVSQLRNVMGEHFSLLKGIRYLLQDFPPGPSDPLLQDQFLRSLKWLGQQSLIFEITVDTARFGKQMYADIIDCIGRVEADQMEGEKTRFIIDHLAKADIASVLSPHKREALAEFERFVSEIAFHPNVAIKCSGYISQLPADLVKQAFDAANEPVAASDAYKECKAALSAFLMPALEAVGENRLLLGSDWPICKLGVLQAGTAEEVQARFWNFTYQLALDVFLDAGLSDQAIDKIFYENAKRMYR